MTRSESHRGEYRKPSRLPTLLLTVLAVAALAAIAALIALSVRPPALSDEQALAMLPAGAELLERHELIRGQVLQIEYRYTQEHEYCLVERTERAPFRYEKGVWSQDGEPELLSETEDWSALAGYWTERTEGSEARFLRLRVDGFADGALTGQVLYQDASASCEDAAEELFSPGARMDGAWLLKGTGFFRYNYLRVDRDGGVYFDNDVSPLSPSELPTEPPMAEDPEADRELLENVIREGYRTWLVATAELNVRPSPEAEDDSLGTVAVGTVLTGTGPRSEDGWYPVAYNDGTGYVSGDCVLELTGDMTVGLITSQGDLNVRAGPGAENEWLGAVGVGVKMVYTALEENWYRVIYGGQTAYVSAEYVTAEPITPPEE